MTQPDEISKVVLKPCPFCGGRAEWGHHDCHNGEHHCCEACGAEVLGGADAWNRRHESTTPAAINPQPVDSRLIDTTPAEARGVVQRWELSADRSRMCEQPSGDYVLHRDYATLACQLAEAKAEDERLRAMLPDLPKRQRECTTLDDWRMAALYYESSWGAASHHCAVIQTRAEQAEAQLAQATARLAAVEGVLQDMLDLRDATQRCELHPKGELVIVKAARAALQPKEPQL